MPHVSHCSHRWSVVQLNCLDHLQSSCSLRKTVDASVGRQISLKARFYQAGFARRVCSSGSVHLLKIDIAACAFHEVTLKNLTSLIRSLDGFSQAITASEFTLCFFP